MFVALEWAGGQVRGKGSAAVKVAVGVLGLALALYPGLAHAWSYERNPYPTSRETETLRKLRDAA